MKTQRRRRVAKNLPTGCNRSGHYYYRDGTCTRRGRYGVRQNSNYEYNDAVLVSMVTLLTTLCVAVFSKGMMKLIPIMLGIVVGYVLCLFLGLINFQPVLMPLVQPTENHDAGI